MCSCSEHALLRSMLAEALVAALDEPKHTSPKGSMCQSFSGNGNHPGIHAPVM